MIGIGWLGLDSPPAGGIWKAKRKRVGSQRQEERHEWLTFALLSIFRRISLPLSFSFFPPRHVGMVGTRRLNEWYQKDFGGKERPSVACLQRELHAKVKLDKNPQGLWMAQSSSLRVNQYKNWGNKIPAIGEEHAFACGVPSVLYITKSLA